MKILLLQPPPRERVQSYDRSAYPHLGLGYLAAYLEEAGYSDLEVIDGRMEGLSLDASIQAVVEAAPDLLGVTARTHEVTLAAELVQAVRDRLPALRTVLGGCHITAEPSATLEIFPAFEFGIAGEGEQALTALCRALENGEDGHTVPGLVWRDGDGTVHVNAPSTPIADLDQLPFPAWHRFRRRRKSYTVFGSRGCPFDCVFCMRVLGKQVRLRSPQNILAEIDWLVEEFGIVAFDFEDETFGLQKEHALAVCRGLMERGYADCLQWTANLRANLVDEELLEAMKKAGCVRVAMGVESGNPKVLASIGKGLNLEAAQKAFLLAHRIGLETVGLFILGHPDETLSTALDTVRFAARLNPTQIAVGIMVPYPGTAVREMALKGEGGYRLLSTSWEDYDKYLGNALELEHLSRRRLELLQAAAYLWFYASNLRFRELWGYLGEHRREARALLGKMLGR